MRSRLTSRRTGAPGRTVIVGCRRESHDMLGTIVAKVVAPDATDRNVANDEKAGIPDILCVAQRADP
ncbi:hypothetical protein [Sphingobium lactosutens]|uniref:hypothetical protein n=1 Tax=Sphingobium lactosutens TaxID=522773 RepID=UPI0015B80F63|nr:hypothetical protein [Sphingobium lactosutens]